jgi:parvulin-like peptidyl-prolyl isomerase
MNPQTVRASHILVSYRGAQGATSSRSRDDAKAAVIRVAQALADGGDFAELARAHSDCPSKAKGGDLGTFGKGQMTPRFEHVAFGLAVGSISHVVETPFGFHVIRRTA